MELRCSSCGKRIETDDFWIEFPCPQCGKAKILRCTKCRKIENQYSCKECGFVGP